MAQATVFSIILMLTAAGYVALAVRMWMDRDASDNRAIAIVLTLIAVWVGGGAIALVTSNPALLLAGTTAHFIGTALIPVVALVGFREYTGTHARLRETAMLMIIPAVTIVLAASNVHHELLWTSAAGASGVPDRWGPWFLFVHAPFSYAVMGAAILRLLAQSTSVAPANRRGALLLSAACTVPIAATLAYDFGLTVASVSPVPFAFAVMLPVFVWLFFVERVAAFSPLANETVFRSMQDPVMVLDGEHRILGLNRTAEHLIDMDEDEALNAHVESVFGHGSTCVFDALDTGHPGKLMTQSGRFLHVRASPITMSGESNRDGQVLTFRDVSDVQRAQAEVRSSEKLLRTLIDLSVNGIIRLRWSEDETGRRGLKCIFANAAAGRFLGVDPESLFDCDASDIVALAVSGMSPEEGAAMIETFEYAVTEGESLDLDVCHHSNMTDRWLRMVAEPIGHDFAVTFIDVTDGKVRERKMESIALSDPLTGLLNRRGFERGASQRLTESADNATGALLFIDLNGFKAINDHCGHEVGDQLLTIAAQRLKKSLRSCDIIGRPGGDEFVALVPDVNAAIADRLATRLTNSLEEPYRIGDESLLCSASIGLALYPDNASTLTGLLREADRAMYRAKERSRDLPNTRDLLEKAV